MLDAQRSASKFEGELNEVKTKLIAAGLSEQADLIAFSNAIAGEFMCFAIVYVSGCFSVCVCVCACIVRMH